MKKIIIAGSALLVILAGCSKSRTETQQAVNDEAWVYDESLPVPVEFSSTGLNVETKALIEGESMEGLDVGVFALRNNPVQGENNTYTYEPNWGPTINDGILLNNEKGKVTSGKIVFEQTRYYPMSGDDGYSFFAYYPYSESAHYTNNGYQVEYDIRDGNDILWGEVHPGYVYQGPLYGFNAAFIRRTKETINSGNGKYSKYLPSIMFYHKLAALKFIAVNESGSQTSNIKVDALSLKDIPRSVILTVGGRVDGVSGELTPSNPGTVDLTLTGDGIPTQDGKEIGTIMICPMEPGAKENILLDITLSVSGGETVTLEDVPLDASSGFAEGDRYTVKLKIKDATAIEISATLDSWSDVGGEIEVPVN